ncbi:sensor domain-containing diguanylate cyclase [Oribacterium sp. WCC10]|uniref:sensor domain-containing diguanylate cyclase n=1 Tax=Oribacterium sp. WCC10 TaxID=1855343 RepID=UPI0015873CE1|nr:sensor domain-containing diguanylate cyclase [Oribacterium sp. WCC10]
MDINSIETDGSLIKSAFMLFDKMSEIQKNLPVAYAVFRVIMNPEGDGAVDAKYLYANDRYCQGVGYEKDKLLNQHLTDTYSDNCEELLYFTYRAAYFGEEKHHTIYSYSLGHWVEFTIAPTNIDGCCIVVSTFIDDSHLERELLRRNSTTDDAIVRIARMISSEGVFEDIMNNMLRELSLIIHSDRLYIMITDDVTMDARFEWCTEGAESYIDRLQSLSFEKYFINWRHYLNDDEVIQIDDAATLKESEPAVYDALMKGGVERFVCAPFYDNKHKLLGFLCTINYVANEKIDTIKLIRTISHFIGFRIRNHTLLQLLDYRGSHDELTGLKNRRVFGESLKVTSRLKDHFGIFYVDLNFFKHANDNYGHMVGNEVLKETARRLSAASDYEVYRLGGDEFAILVDDDISEEEYKDILRSLDEAFQKPVLETDEYTINIGISAGFAMAPVDGTNPNELRKIADMRMYENKRRIHEELMKNSN